jgi:hypothetical protein
MANSRSFDFLPDFFKTSANKRFLGSTLDQLISEPSLRKFNGYIGRQFAPVYRAGDNYIQESNSIRQNYQLEPAVVVVDDNRSNFYASYQDLIQQIQFYGGLTNRHDRLFSNQSYSYNGNFDFDKLSNFNNYYWLPNGPEPVDVGIGFVRNDRDFVINFNNNKNSYTVDVLPGFNPEITLRRSGNYRFNTAELPSGVWIQTEPSLTGFSQSNPKLSVRLTEDLGVINNGGSAGVIRFDVPDRNSQESFKNMPLGFEADIATDLQYSDIANRPLADIIQQFGSIGGFSGDLDGKFLIFVDQTNDESGWISQPAPAPLNITYPSNTVDLLARANAFQINLIDNNGQQIVVLNDYYTTPENTRILVKSGIDYSGLQFFRRAGENLLVIFPLITADLDTLYYVSDSTPGLWGKIKLVDSESDPIDIEQEILGKTEYISPNGIEFTNGLKIRLDQYVAPATYQNQYYYVEGVGTGIKLVTDTGTNSSVDYFTINRSSKDQNDWSRTNRWFHSAVIEASARIRGVNAVFNQTQRAKRPIIEFDADLQLFNHGKEFVAEVNYFDDVIEDAFGNELTTIFAGTTSLSFQGQQLTSGDTIVFGADQDQDVRGTVYQITIVELDEQATVLLIPIIGVEEFQNIRILSGTNTGKNLYYTNQNWVLSQKKIDSNQYPLFDIVDDNFQSLSQLNLSEFAGSKLFSYKIGSGKSDPVLGQPLSYKNIDNLGDIEFENNFQSDTYRYFVDNAYVTDFINRGFVVKNVSRTQQQKLNIWTKVETRSQQYQQYTEFADGSTDTYLFDLIPVELELSKAEVKVYLDNILQNIGQYNLTITDKTQISFNSPLLEGTKLDVLIISNQQDPRAFYQIPTNLENNSLNSEFETLTLGQIRNHTKEIFSVHRDLIGLELGSNNSRDLQYKTLPGTILQHSSPLIYPSIFLTHPDANIIDSIYYAQKEYSKFKNRFLESAKKLNFQDSSLIPDYIDQILTTINNSKGSTSPWYYSDMVPYGSNTRIYNYEILAVDSANYQIETIFDNKKASNRAILVYLNGQQLVVDRDYAFSQELPAVILSDSLERSLEDQLTIVEYIDTDANFIPETPTKLGLYPKFLPEIFVDDRYAEPQTVIQGHDGSITIAFGDYRDQLLLELEKRIYNNIKTEFDVENRSVLWDVLPGKFRNSDYTRNEFNSVIAKSFLKWVGSNQLDYISNTYFNSNNPKTWNYKTAVSVVDDEPLPGNWRAIYRYFYDTDRPHSHPWEMLGFSEKPSWWETYYGPAPYTGGNLVMWDDLENGVIRSGSRQGQDLRFARANLKSIIPVNDYGELKTPDQFLLRNFAAGDVSGVWSAGDSGPVETAWKSSSDYPFAIQIALALTRPSDYFGLLINNHRYKFDLELNQLLFEGTNNRVKSSQIVINGLNDSGSISRAASYTNYVVEYLNNQGRSGAEFLTNILDKVDVRLSYRMAGFSDKKFLKIFAEQTSPGSINDSVLIPEENYQLYLHRSTPLRRAVYSSVIVRKTTNGYAVEGYDYNNPFFTIVPSRNNGNFFLIKGIDRTARIYRDFQSVFLTIPYGFEFSNRQQVVDFLISYQRYLNSLGYIFSDFNNDLRQPQNWELSSREFLTWSEQGWGSDSIIVLSPAIGHLTLNDDQATVAEINSSWTGSRLLDQNFAVLATKDYNVIRDNDSFELETVNAKIVGLADLALVQYEHVLILDNITDFQDVVYDPGLGSRQFRLKLIGQKTDGWNGRLSAPGFMYSNGVIPEWQISRDYNRGDLVIYKNRVYSANDFIPGENQFDFTKWQLNTTAGRTPELLLNFASSAKKFINIYDVDADYLDVDLENLSNNLIGFSSRDYFDDFILENKSQVKFYQGFIKEKGTQGAVNALTNATFNKLEGSIEYYEDWAVRVGTYGAVDNLRSTEILLTEQPGTSNPFGIEILSDQEQTTAEFRTIYQSQLYVSGLNRDNNLFTDRTLTDGIFSKDLITAGFVDPTEVDNLVFDIKNSRDQLDNFIANAGSNKLLWTARDYNGVWNVYRTSPSRLTVSLIEYGLDNTAEITTTTINDLQPGEVIVVKDFDPILDGIYQILNKDNLKTVTVSVAPEQVSYLESVVTVESTGMIFKIDSAKLERLSNLETRSNWAEGNLVYINDPNSWQVYQKNHPWQWGTRLISNETDSEWGNSITVSTDQNFLIVGVPVDLDPRLEYYNITGPAPYKFTINPQVNDSSEFGYSLDSAEKKIYVGTPGYDSDRGYLAIYNQVGNVYYLDQILPGAASGNRLGHSVTSSKDSRWLYVGAPGDEKVFIYKLVDLARQSGSITGDGSSIYTLDFVPESVESIRVYQNSSWLVPGIDYTVAGDQITFSSGVTGVIFYYQTSYYQYIDYLELDTPNIGDNFGHRVKTTTDGRQLAISAPEFDDRGSVFVYDRVVEAFDAVQGQMEFTAQRTLINYDVNLNGSRKAVSTDYVNTSGNTIKFNYTLTQGDRVEIETNNFVLISELQGSFPQSDSRFGDSLDICSFNCSVYVGQPNYTEPNYARGIVNRFSNLGRVKGEVYSGIIGDPNDCVTDSSSLRINDYEIIFSNTDSGFPTLDYVANKINSSELPGISAQVVIEGISDYRLYIVADSQFANNRLRILPGAGDALTTLNLSVFTSVQTITKPNQSLIENFGSEIRVNPDSDTVAISSKNANLNYPTSFDTQLTTFDNSSTNLFDQVNRSGTVYVFELVNDLTPYTNILDWQPNTTYLKDQLFIYDKKIYIVKESFTSASSFENSVRLQAEITDSHFVYVSDLVPSQLIGSGSLYGKSLILTNKLFGIVSKSQTQGRVDIFRNADNQKFWQKIREQQPIVDLDSVAGLSLYNRRTNQLVTRIDYVDPLRGKILGVADQNIDIKVAGDPAVYNTINGEFSSNDGKYYWSKQYIGRVWWDLDRVRYIEYQQKDRAYRADRWGQLFPGSEITIYEWIESTVPPSRYQQQGFSGVPLYPDDSRYTQIATVDSQTGILRTRYYYWVRDKNTAVVGKNISINGIADIIASPILQDIPYAAILDKNSLSLYNCDKFLSGDDIVLRINSFGTAKDLPVHNEWALIPEKDDAVFPDFLINKIVDSLLGNQQINEKLFPVPDPALPENLKYGISIRPRQSIFRDRLTAAKIFIEYINRELAKVIVVGKRDLTGLSAQEALPDNTQYDFVFDSLMDLLSVDLSTIANGTRILILSDSNLNSKWSIYTVNDNLLSLTDYQSFKLENFWNYRDWYSLDYDIKSVPDFVVETFDRVAATGATEGQIVRVKNTGNGTWGIYQVNTDGLKPVALESATIEFSNLIYDPVSAGIGFDVLSFDAGEFDKTFANDFRLIFQALRNDIAIQEFSYIFTGSMFSLIEYVFYEQPNPDWIFKTGFIDVLHKIRKLIQYPNYVKDNQDYYKKYIEEVKPYKTKIRQYLLDYTGNDDVELDMTDFDFPVYYDFQENRYRHPADDSELLQQVPWKYWNDNIGFSIESVSVLNTGFLYQVEPTLIPDTGDGTANLRAVLDAGSISSVNIVNEGDGFFSNSIVTVIPSPNPDGSLGRAAQILARVNNKKIRTMDVRLKFDRIEYTGEIQDWAAGTNYRIEDFFVYQGNIYVVVGDFTSGMSFESPGSGLGVNYRSALPDDLDSAMKRTRYYYMPKSDMTPNDVRQLFQGVDYPGVQVTSYSFFNTTSSTSFEINTTAEKHVFVLDDTISVIPNQYVKISFDDVNYVKCMILNFDTQTQELEVRIIDRVGQGTYSQWVLESIEVSDRDIEIEGAEQPDLRNLDVIYRSQFLDTSLGTRVEDIDIHGGRFIDTINSHAPEELVPGRIYDTLEIRVFNKLTNNSHVGFRLFYGMNTNLEDANLNPEPTVQLIEPMTELSTSVRVVEFYTRYELMRPVTALNQELPIVINGEYMTYNAYDPETQTISGITRGVNGTTIRSHPVDSFVTVLNQMKNTREYYRISAQNTAILSQDFVVTDKTMSLVDASVLPAPSATDNVPGVIFVNGEKIYYWVIDYENNKIGQLVRGVHGTGIANRHLAGSRVVDSGRQQKIEDGDFVVWSQPSATLEDSNTIQADFLRSRLSYNPV